MREFLATHRVPPHCLRRCSLAHHRFPCCSQCPLVWTFASVHSCYGLLISAWMVSTMFPDRLPNSFEKRPSYHPHRCFCRDRFWILLCHLAAMPQPMLC